MKLQDPTCEPCVSGDWIAKAERLGVESAHAGDVVSAVMSFCRLRHGETTLDEEYVSFLIARSASVARGNALDPEHAEKLCANHSVCQKMFLRALASSTDPSALYDTYRMKLVSVHSSDVSDSGFVLSANLSRVSAAPHENISLLWLELFKRVGQCLADWRAGNPQLKDVMVRIGNGRGGELRDLIDLFVQTFRRIETRRNLPSAHLIRPS